MEAHRRRHSLLLYGNSTGLTGTGSVLIHQDLGQVPGGAEPGEEFGSAVAFADSDNDGHADTATDVEGENTGDGRISRLLGAATMPPASTGTAYLGCALRLGTTSYAGGVLAP
ncbi:hypothetical protein OG979_34870 [Actinomadura citrea]|uniref:hypothetical protein n=1 Tax=Actinomadura citrea TaxID=46158 RepID=UPI002E2BA4B4|nr:hypothetical protein [Actinomadura citrea]